MRRFCDLEDILANSAPSGPNDYNTKIIEEFRATGGRVGGPWAGITLILIHHTGAKSGIERVSPVAYSLRREDRLAIWAANGGSPAHPNWYYNLKAEPRIKVEVGTQTLTVLAEEFDDTARAELWPKLAAQYPQLGETQASVPRLKSVEDIWRGSRGFPRRSSSTRTALGSRSSAGH